MTSCVWWYHRAQSRLSCHQETVNNCYRSAYISKICSSLTRIKWCLGKSFTYHRRKVAQTPAHCSFLISQSSFCKLTDDLHQNNEKPSPGRSKTFYFPWSLDYVTFLSMSCISYVCVEFLLRWHSQIWVWMVEDKMVLQEFHFVRVLRARARQVNKWCQGHA